MPADFNTPLAMSAGLAAIAAIFWFCSALVKFPKEVKSILIVSDGPRPEKDDFDRLFDAIRLQSRLSSYGAIAAAGAAIAQIWDLLL